MQLRGCAICRYLLFYELSLAHKLTLAGKRSERQRRFYALRAEDVVRQIIKASRIKSLHICNEEHRKQAIAMRRNALSSRKGSILRMQDKVKLAQDAYDDATLNAVALSLQLGAMHKDTIRAIALKTHYKVLLAQRKRRLRELVHKNKEVTI